MKKEKFERIMDLGGKILQMRLPAGSSIDLPGGGTLLVKNFERSQYEAPLSLVVLLSHPEQYIWAGRVLPTKEQFVAYGRTHSDGGRSFFPWKDKAIDHDVIEEAEAEKILASEEKITTAFARMAWRRGREPHWTDSQVDTWIKLDAKR